MLNIIFDTKYKKQLTEDERKKFQETFDINFDEYINGLENINQNQSISSDFELKCVCISLVIMLRNIFNIGSMYLAIFNLSSQNDITDFEKIIQTFMSILLLFLDQMSEKEIVNLLINFFKQLNKDELILIIRSYLKNFESIYYFLKKLIDTEQEFFFNTDTTHQNLQ